VAEIVWGCQDLLDVTVHMRLLTRAFFFSGVVYSQVTLCMILFVSKPTATYVALTVTIWKLGRTMYVYSMVEKREGERLEIYTGGISPCSRTVYQTCNMSPAQVHL